MVQPGQQPRFAVRSARRRPDRAASRGGRIFSATGGPASAGAPCKPRPCRPPDQLQHLQFGKCSGQLRHGGRSQVFGWSRRVELYRRAEQHALGAQTLRRTVRNRRAAFGTGRWNCHSSGLLSRPSVAVTNFANWDRNYSPPSPTERDFLFEPARPRVTGRRGIWVGGQRLAGRRHDRFGSRDWCWCAQWQWCRFSRFGTHQARMDRQRSFHWLQCSWPDE